MFNLAGRGGVSAWFTEIDISSPKMSVEGRAFKSTSFFFFNNSNDAQITNIRFALPHCDRQSFLVIYLQGMSTQLSCSVFAKVFFLHKPQDSQSDSCSLRVVSDKHIPRKEITLLQPFFHFKAV